MELLICARTAAAKINCCTLKCVHVYFSFLQTKACSRSLNLTARRSGSSGAKLYSQLLVWVFAGSTLLYYK